ncbi:(S)-benzoin forming benzil reductase [Paenibacillus daejeonensis]|uniref:(S)-benzoin forming benzil reductase n=1 Tax=Paenibacillus daejeonensis TaxID=135193 RepID=UPI00038220F8|nr:(S)-benzoin forming benzil reductase [Paenibacillus daejeonensis]
MNYYIITGTSRGIGEALALQLLAPSSHIICISRTLNPRLTELATERNSACTQLAFDLLELKQIDSLFDEIVRIIGQDHQPNSIALINNAGMLSPVSPAERLDAQAIADNVTLNLLAPMTMTAAFLRAMEAWQVDKRILNVSSGSAKFLLPGQSCYSTSKAGLDTFSKSVNVEQQTKSHRVKIASVYPGMIDTQMQSEIRELDAETFPHVGLFIQAAEQGQLQTPAYTAEKLLALLNSDDFGSEPLVEAL